MADFLYVTEISRHARNAQGQPLDAALLHTMKTTVLEIGGASKAMAAPVADDTVTVRLYATARCAIACGEDPVADASGVPLAPDTPEEFGVGKGHKIAVIAL